MTPVSIRSWQSADLPAIRSLLWQSWLATYSNFIPRADLRTYFDAHYALKAMKMLFKNPDVCGLVAEKETTLCGFARTRINREDERFYLPSLYLLPGHEGRGLGRMLLHAAQEEARRRGFHALWLGVMVQNSRALSWYRKLGFEFFDTLPFTMGETTVDHLLGCLKIEQEESDLCR
jgi:diamine N-acetyltransferase